MTSRNSRIAYTLCLATIAAGTAWMLAFSTPEGLGLSDDSIAYIAGARSLMNGLGYRELWLASSQPVTHLPPGYSSILAVAGLVTGLDPIRGARLVNGLLSGGNALLMGVLGWQMTRSRIAGLILALIFTVNASLLRVHSDAMSEPLYIFLTLLTFLAFARYLKSAFFQEPSGRSRYAWLILMGCLTGIAYLTRYAGLTIVATILVALFFFQNTWTARFVDSAIYLAGVIPWLVAWTIRNRVLGGTSTNRLLEWHPIKAENYGIAIYNGSEFLIPVESWRRGLMKAPYFFEVVLVLLGLSLLIWLVKKIWLKLKAPASTSLEPISFLNGIYIFAYLTSVIVSMTLFDASTKFRSRILSPVYVALLVLLIAAGMWLWNRRARYLRFITTIITILIIGLSLYDTIQVMTILHRGGQGYASFQWYDSKAIAFLRSLPPELKIFTNEPGAVYLYTGRGTYVLPTRTDPVTSLARPGFEAGVEVVKQEVRSGRAVLALFDGGETQPEDTELLKTGLFLAHKSSGDEIYTAAP